MKGRGIGLILAGGKSSRLFPILRPKPLLEVEGKSLLAEAMARLKGLETRVLANKQIAKEISSYFRKKGSRIPKFIVEPEGRDTAAAVGFGLREISKLKPSWVAVLSADQWMPQTKDFSKFLKTVEAEIKKHPDSLFVAGSSAQTKPAHLHSNFGWIIPKGSGQLGAGSASRAVVKFVEKPPSSMLADLYSRDGLVNCGMFFGKYETFLKAYAEFYPDVLDKKKKFSKLERQPIDRAIFEKFSNVRVIDFPLQWEDLGTWEDWHRCFAQTSSEDVFVRKGGLKEVYCFGMSDVAIVEDSGRLLVMPLSEASNLKSYLESI